MLKELFIRLFYYNSILNCNIVSYQRINEDLNFKGLSRTFIHFKKIDSVVYDRLTDQVIDEFGISNEAKSLYYLRRNMLKMVCQYYINKDMSMIGKIGFKKKEIEESESRMRKPSMLNNVKQRNSSNHRIISKWANCNTKKLSIFDYFNYAKDYENENKKNQAA